jgi:CheY-like chemotaxis protein
VIKVCGEAVDGFDAIQKAQALKPDLIILDLSMPRMGGVEAAQRLKKFLP